MGFLFSLKGMAVSFEKVRDQAESESVKGGKDQTKLLRNLDARQRKALGLLSTPLIRRVELLGFGRQVRQAVRQAGCWISCATVLSVPTVTLMRAKSSGVTSCPL